MNEFKKFFLVFFLISASYFAFSAALVWFVDPFNELGRNTIGVYASADRQRINQIAKQDHNAILIGSSKIRGIDTQKIHCYDFYNAGFTRALPEEMFFYLDRYLTNEKFVAIGLDFYMFNERMFPFVEMTGWQERSFGTLEYLTSYRSFSTAVFALDQWSKGKKPELEFEKRFHPDTPPQTGRGEGEQKLEKTDYAAVIDLVTNHYFKRPKVSVKRIELMRQLRQQLIDRKIPFVFFINPHNYEILKVLRSDEVRPSFERWRVLLRAAVPELIDLSESEWSALRHYPRVDPYHYYSEAGVEFMNKIVTCESSSREGS